MSRSRRAWAMVIAAGATCAVLALTSCDAVFVDPAPAGSAILGLGFSVAPAGAGDARAFDQADAARIQLRRGRDGRAVLDGSFPLSGAGSQRVAAVELDVLEDSETFDLDATLVSGSQALFRGAASVSVRKGQTASAEVPLQPIIAQIRLSETSVTLDAIGQTMTLRAAALFATDDTASGVAIQWQSQDASIVSASQDGSITARGEGRTQVVARAGAVSALVQVRVQARTATVTVVPAGLDLIVGDERTLTAVARDRNGHTLVRTPEWSSGNVLAATVDATGRVRAVGAGQATVFATVEGRTGTATVRVSLDPVESVEVTPATATINVGETVRYTATLRTASGAVVDRPVQWTSSNSAVATVDATGLVEGQGVGSATIGATSEGVTGSSQVQVRAGAVAEPDLVAGTPTVTPAAPTTSQAFTIRADIANTGNAASGTFGWRLRVGPTVVSSGQSSLAAGASTTVSASGVGPYGAGTYEAWLDVDPAGAVRESDETNNSGRHSFTVRAPLLPDLVAGPVTVTPSNPSSAATFTIQGSVANAGNAASGSFMWRLVVTTSISVMVVDSAWITLAAGQSTTVSAPRIGPYATGSYTASLDVDPAGAIPESDERNNQASTPFIVGAWITTSPTSITDTLPSGATVLTPFGVANTGADSIQISLATNVWWLDVLNSSFWNSGNTHVEIRTRQTSPFLRELRPGTHVGEIRVTGAAANSPVIVPVTLTVRAPPQLSNLQVDTVKVGQCTWNQLTGSIFEYTFDYTDDDGDFPQSPVMTGTATFNPSGTPNPIDWAASRISGDGFSGTMLWSACWVFVGDSSVTVVMSTKDGAGNSSNPVSLTSPRPPGAPVPPPAVLGSARSGGSGVGPATGRGVIRRQ